MKHRLLSIVALAAVAGCATASQSAAPACAADARVPQAVEMWNKLTPFPALEFKSTTDARCFKAQFLRALAPKLGAPVGYKVGLYSKAARAAYHTDEPRLGYLYANMISPSGAQVPAAYGSGPTWESDLLLVVKDDGINTAKDKAEVYKHLRGFRPFIELPNRNYAADVNVTADQVEALNVGARYGVMSAEQPLPQTPEAMAALVNFSVETVITGTEPRTETGRAIDTLGDVLEIALFARDHALAEGHKLKAGDLISIGVVTPARAPVAGQDLEVRYHILPTTSSVSVRFR